MAVLPGASTGCDDERMSSHPVATASGAAVRADGVELIGEMVGSGYREPPALARRGDGQTFQLTPLVYLVLATVDGRRSYDEVGERVSAAYGRTVIGDNVRSLVDQQLRPLGLVAREDGSQPDVKKSNPLLALRFKYAVSDPEQTRRVTSPFARLFHPVVVALVMAAFVAVSWWVFFHKGLASATHQAFDKPGLLLLVVAVTVLSAGFHEFGHAAGARRGGATPGVMGAGIYLVWPAFYTDVTDSYRLGRGGRIRTDLGGLYFHAIVVVLTFGWWYVTRWEAVLLLVATQTMQMVHQLLPMLRFDGYHLLADLTGVPDLYHRMRPTLLGLLPHRWFGPENRVLKPWARAVIIVWVLITIPMMAIMLTALVAAVPRLLGTAWAVVHDDAAGVLDSWRNGGLVDTAAHGLEVFAVVLPLMAGFLILGRIGFRWSRGLVRWSRGSAPRRFAAVILSAAVVTGLSWAWMPRPGTYRPIGPDEKGLLTALLPASHRAVQLSATSSPGARLRPASGLTQVGGSAAHRLAGGAPLQATFRKGEALPSKAHPRLAIVLVPSHGQRHPQPGVARGEPVEPTGPTEPTDPTDSTEPWVFPFDKPLPPAEGDNQAAA